MAIVGPGSAAQAWALSRKSRSGKSRRSGGADKRAADAQFTDTRMAPWPANRGPDGLPSGISPRTEGNHMTFRFTTLTGRVALAALLVQVGLTAAHAGPITGSGQPISDIQPSLGLNYIVRLADPGTNIADIGQVALFAGNFAPAGWALANGQQLPINSNQILFSRIGTTYGGNGTTPLHCRT